MGMFKGRWLSGGSTAVATGNPNPMRFEVIREAYVNSHWITELRYPDCTNFEGRKIVVTQEKVSGRASFDPHFFEDGDVIARFRPDGWSNAILFVNATL